MEQEEIKAMLTKNEATMHHYERCLVSTHDTSGMDYLCLHGFTEETLEKFHIGYAPQNSDVFAGHVIFPWFDVRGNVIAFTGRRIDYDKSDGSLSKYKFSPSSIIYQKDHELWGLYQAKRGLRYNDFLYIVEGFSDVMMLHQVGIENVVSCSGCKLTEEQMNLLSRYTHDIVLLYPSDEAGIHGAQRAIDALVRNGFHVSAVLLPDGEDPCSFFYNHTKEKVEKYLSAHKQNFVMFIGDVCFKTNDDVIFRANVINRILEDIFYVEDCVLQELYIKELVKLSEIGEDILRKRMAQIPDELKNRKYLI